jgi:hypothetical protein
MVLHLPMAASTAVGSLPHTDPVDAARFVLHRLADLPAVPSLPRRSPREAMLAQGAVGIAGVSIDASGALVVLDPDGLDPEAPVHTPLDDDAFCGLRTFLVEAEAAGHRGAVKWQVTGPVTLGLALIRAGVPVPTAFALSAHAVDRRIEDLAAAVAAGLPGCDQVVVVDEPGLGVVLRDGAPLGREESADLVSGALASLERAGSVAVAGVHCCGEADWGLVLACGPQLLSLPVGPGVLPSATALGRYLDGGGLVAWGAVPTDRPLSAQADRYWHDLVALWCELVRSGVDPIRLRTQALVTPACGLAHHDVDQAARVLELVAEVGTKMATQAVAATMNLGG